MGDLTNPAEYVGDFQIAAVSDVYGPRRDAVKQPSNTIATPYLDYREVLVTPCSVGGNVRIQVAYAAECLPLWDLSKSSKGMVFG